MQLCLVQMIVNLGGNSNVCFSTFTNLLFLYQLCPKLPYLKIHVDCRNLTCNFNFNFKKFGNFKSHRLKMVSF